MNLPYYAQFKRESVILLGIIPGRDEPPRAINQYLILFVKEMLQKNMQFVRCILLVYLVTYQPAENLVNFGGTPLLLGVQDV